ncbi:MAG: DUF222 domain-containing protein, partial [Pseudonocardiaceae bacterium]
ARCASRTGEQIAAVGAEEALTTLAVARRWRARADALEAHALDRLDRVRGGDRSVPTEAALELRTSRHNAAGRLDRARALVGRMPRLLAAMQAGDLEGYPAGRIVEATAMLSEEHARQVDERLADKLAAGVVGFTDPTGLLRAARRLVEKVDPSGQTARARRARADRRVELISGDNATATLLADLPAEVAASAYSRIDGMARTLRRRGEDRTLDQLRADIYADLLLGNDPGINPPGGAATVFLHMPIDTALTMNDTGCELSGYGPIPAPIAREIMTNAHSTWRTVLTDPATGAPRSLARTRRRPSAFIRDLVAIRDRECTTPGCHRPAQRSDFDHLTDWGRGKNGTTAEDNGGSKCEFDHYLKDQPGWTLDYNTDTGVSTITTPTGRTYTRHRHTITQPSTSTQDKPAEPTPTEKPHAPNPQKTAADPPGDDPPY